MLLKRSSGDTTITGIQNTCNVTGIQIHVGNTKNTWKTINNLINKSKKSSNVNEICDKNGKPIDINNIPDAFNNHFTDNIPACSTPPESYITEATQQFAFCDITEQKVYELHY